MYLKKEYYVKMYKIYDFNPLDCDTNLYQIELLYFRPLS